MTYKITNQDQGLIEVLGEVGTLNPFGQVSPESLSFTNRVSEVGTSTITLAAETEAISSELNAKLANGNALIAGANGKIKDWVERTQKEIVDAVSQHQVDLEALASSDESLEKIQTALRTAKFSLGAHAHIFSEKSLSREVSKEETQSLMGHIRQLNELETGVKQMRALLALVRTVEGFMVEIDEASQCEEKVAKENKKAPFEHIKLRVWNPEDPNRVGLGALDTKAQKSITQAIASKMSFGILGSGAVDRTGGKVKEWGRWGINQFLGTKESSKKVLVMNFRGTAEAIGTANLSLLEGYQAISDFYSSGIITEEHLQALQSFVRTAKVRIGNSIQLFEKVLATYQKANNTDKIEVVKARVEAFKTRQQQFGELLEQLGGEKEEEAKLPLLSNEEVDHSDEVVIVGNVEVRDVQLADAIAKKRSVRQQPDRGMASVLAGNARSVGLILEGIKQDAGYEILNEIVVSSQEVDRTLMKFRNEGHWASRTMASLINDWEQFGDDPAVDEEVQSAFKQIFTYCLGDGLPTGWKREMILAICSEASPFLYNLFDPA